jgi:hypothetical protein
MSCLVNPAPLPPCTANRGGFIGFPVRLVIGTKVFSKTRNHANDEPHTIIDIATFNGLPIYEVSTGVNGYSYHATPTDLTFCI